MSITCNDAYNGMYLQIGTALRSWQFISQEVDLFAQKKLLYKTYIPYKVYVSKSDSFFNYLQIDRISSEAVFFSNIFTYNSGIA